jgi:hypothetical protein
MSPEGRRLVRGGFELAGIGIILVVLAVAAPNLTRDRKFAEEMVAVKAISIIQTEEARFHSQYGYYATSLRQLGPPTSGSPGADGADLIDKELAAGEKGDFKFTLRPSPNGYIVTAARKGSGTGVHTFYSDQNMGIFHQRGGPEPAQAPQKQTN